MTLASVVYVALVVVLSILIRSAVLARLRRGSGRWPIAERQLVATRRGDFQAVQLMNHGERRVFAAVEQAARRQGLRVFAQVNLGEILTSADRPAFAAINAKRVDMLVVDQEGWPILAIEVQGSGHYLGDARVRDAIKRIALRKAGVDLIEFNGVEAAETIVRKVAARLKRAA